MPNILVADDSPVELRLTSGLLEARGWTVRTATNGDDAHAAAMASRPDVVVTDLKMPGLNGLQLLDAINERYGNVPVVIVTSRGTEEVAIEALRNGAAGYLPKRRLGADLVGVVERLLELSATRHITERWETFVVRRTIAVELPNERSLVAETVRQVQSLLEAAGWVEERERLRTGVAVNEALVNAMVHGNLEVSSDLRESGDDAYERLIEQRLDVPPFRDRRVLVDAVVTPGSARIVIRDEGAGFDVSALPDPTDAENLLRCSGRGILMMRSFMDEVTYNETGNAVTLVKTRPVENDPTVPVTTPQSRQLIGVR